MGAFLLLLASVLPLAACCFTPVGASGDSGAGGGPDAAGLDGGTTSGGTGGTGPAQCIIDGGTYGDGVLRPSNPCQSCQLAFDPRDWTNLPAGTACSGSGLCDSKGACIASACDIGGVVYPRGAAKPQDPSFCCSPSLNRSDWSFRLQDGGTYQADQRSITAMAVADFDGDGRKDLAVITGNNSGRPTVNVWLARDGGFQGPTVYLEADCQLCMGLVVGDITGDGFPDLLVPSTIFPPQRVLALINYGDGTGTFGPAIETPFPDGNVGALLLVDLDRDGVLDMAVPGSAAYFLKGLGDGGFAEPVAYSLGGATSASTIVAGDFQNRGIIDLVTTSGAAWPLPASITMLAGDGQGRFSPALFPLVAHSPAFLAVGDFNGDGLLDVGFSEPQFGVGFVSGAGNGTFGPELTVKGLSTLQSGYGADPLSVADLDNNGRTDFIASSDPNTLMVFWSNSDNTITESVLPGGYGVTLATDLNGDGTPDILLGRVSGMVNLFVNECR